MKVYISADIEGITGISHWDETMLDRPDSVRAREQMGLEVAAACEAAVAAGATEILVKDAHDSARNFDPQILPHCVRIIRGWSGHPYSMMQELDESFAAVIMIGCHSAGGSSGSPLSHTLSRSLADIHINDERASEFLINAYTAEYAQVPVVCVTGDAGICDEVGLLNPAIGVLAVQEGVGGSSISMHPQLALRRIRDAVGEALAKDRSQCRLALPKQFEVELCYRDHALAYRNSFYPGMTRVDGSTLLFVADDWFEVLRMLVFAA